MKTHTPGPWTVAKRTVSKRPATVVLDAEHNEVCEVYACSALIAAAPDMLETLREIVDWLDGAESFPLIRAVSCVQALHAARAAIVRATGGQA